MDANGIRVHLVDEDGLVTADRRIYTGWLHKLETHEPYFSGERECSDLCTPDCKPKKANFVDVAIV